MALIVETANDITRLILDDRASRNALDDGVLASIRQALDNVRAASLSQTLIITGANEFFSTGGSIEQLRELSALAAQNNALPAIESHMRDAALATGALLATPARTIALVNGPCVGAALALVQACDIRLATPRAKFLSGYSRLGLSSDLGLFPLLVARLGTEQARSWISEYSPLDASAALAFGLVDAVVADDDSDFTKFTHLNRPAIDPGDFKNSCKLEAAEFARRMLSTADLSSLESL